MSAAPFDSLNLGSGVPDDPAAVRQNRHLLARRIGLDDDALVWMQQVHGKNVADVTEPRATPVAQTDALVTTRPGIALMVLVADCVPVLASDRVAGVIGAAHSGRKGSSAGVAPEMVGRMVQLGAAREDLEIVLGPAICGACYEVPSQMRDEVEAVLPGSSCVTRDGTPGLDLRAGLARQLGDLGVPRVRIDPRCTREDHTLFSHRRAALTGRFAAALWMDPNPIRPTVCRGTF